MSEVHGSVSGSVMVTKAEALPYLCLGRVVETATTLCMPAEAAQKASETRVYNLLSCSPQGDLFKCA